MNKFILKATGLLKSKTFWVNALMFFLIVFPRVINLPQITLSAELTSLIVFVVNAILRWITKESLEKK